MDSVPEPDATFLNCRVPCFAAPGLTFKRYCGSGVVVFTPLSVPAVTDTLLAVCVFEGLPIANLQVTVPSLLRVSVTPVIASAVTFTVTLFVSAAPYGSAARTWKVVLPAAVGVQENCPVLLMM